MEVAGHDGAALDLHFVVFADSHAQLGHDGADGADNEVALREAGNGGGRFAQAVAYDDVDSDGVAELNDCRSQRSAGGREDVAVIDADIC